MPRRMSQDLVRRDVPEKVGVSHNQTRLEDPETMEFSGYGSFLVMVMVMGWVISYLNG